MCTTACFNIKRTQLILISIWYFHYSEFSFRNSTALIDSETILFLSLRTRNDMRFRNNFLFYQAVSKSFYFLQSFVIESFIVRYIEPCLVNIFQRSILPHMFSENVARGSIDQMRCCMMQHELISPIPIYYAFNSIPNFKDW